MCELSDKLLDMADPRNNQAVSNYHGTLTQAADELDARSATIEALEKAAKNIIEHTERYEGQDRFTIAKWQMDALEDAMSIQAKGVCDGQVR